MCMSGATLMYSESLLTDVLPSYCRTSLPTGDHRGWLGKECEHHVLGCLWTADTTNRVPCSHCDTVAFVAFVAAMLWMPFAVRACMIGSVHTCTLAGMWPGALWEAPCMRLPRTRPPVDGAPAALLGSVGMRAC